VSLRLGRADGPDGHFDPPHAVAAVGRNVGQPVDHAHVPGVVHELVDHAGAFGGDASGVEQARDASAGQVLRAGPEGRAAPEQAEYQEPLQQLHVALPPVGLRASRRNPLPGSRPDPIPPEAASALRQADARDPQ
jgi:hypothetical protein